MKEEKLALNANLTRWKIFAKSSPALVPISQIYIDSPNNSAFIASDLRDFVLLSVGGSPDQQDLLDFFGEFDAQTSFFLVRQVLDSLEGFRAQGLYFQKVLPENLYLDPESLELRLAFSRVD